MTDALIPAPEPRLAVDGTTLSTALENARPSLGQFLGASAAEGFWQTIAGQAAAQGRVRQAEIGAPAEELLELDEAAWRASPNYREGIPFRPGITGAGARALAEVYDENRSRRALMAQREPGLGEMALGFGAGIAGSLPTPENFIPFAGPAMRAAQAQRYSRQLRALAEAAQRGMGGGLGARALAGAGMGALDGFLGSLATLPLVNASRDDFGDDVTWSDMLLDLALGTAAGGVLGSGLAAALGRRHAAPGAIGGTDTPASQETALRGLVAAADGMAQADAVDVAMLPPDARAELERLRVETQRLRTMLQPEGDESLSGRTAARPLMATGAAAPGATWRATTPAGTELAGTYEVVELDSLTASHTLDFAENPAFPQELQPRDRSQAERQQQVREIAGRLRPEEVEASPLTTTGAPIVGPSGIVESGNGRTLAIATAYGQNLATAQAYRAFLARLGFDQAATMRQPILVRRRSTELDQATLRRVTEESNVDVTDRLTAAEQARVDARRMDASMLQLLQSNDLAAAGNAPFLRAFIGSLTGRDQRELSQAGELTADGLQRITRAMVARAYPDSELVGRLAQSPDAAAEGIGRALVAAAPALARLRALIEAGQVRPELDATAALIRAVQRIEGARGANRPLSTLFDQVDAFDNPSPLEAAWLAMLLRHPVRQDVGGVSWANIVERIEAFARRAAEAPTEPDMFGAPPPGVGPVMAAAMRDANLESARELRDLAADPFVPPPEAPRDPPRPPENESRGNGAEREQAPEPPPEAPAPAGDRLATAAAEREGLDVSDAGELAEAARLTAAGRLPEELTAALQEAEQLAAKLERADETWQAAAACAIRG